MSIENILIFIDTNIWLDFYRVRNETALSMLNHIEDIIDHVIVTHQLEMEFKKNRQTAILEGMNEIKSPQGISRPGIFSDAKAVQKIQKAIKSADDGVKTLKKRFPKVLTNPTTHDPVYQVAQRIFRKSDSLALAENSSDGKLIKRKALRRFLSGQPPRKKNDTSIGDAINWEWIIHCAREYRAKIVIVSRDGDYGLTVGEKCYLNDYLKQDFSEQVSQKRNIYLYSKLSEALRHFKIRISKEEIEEESNLQVQQQQSAITEISNLKPLERLQNILHEFSNQLDSTQKASNLHIINSDEKSEKEVIQLGSKWEKDSDDDLDNSPPKNISNQIKKED